MNQNGTREQESEELLASLHDHLSTLPLFYLREIPGFNEEHHLELLLRAHRAKKKHSQNSEATHHFVDSNTTPLISSCQTGDTCQRQECQMNNPRSGVEVSTMNQIPADTNPGLQSALENICASETMTTFDNVVSFSTPITTTVTVEETLNQALDHPPSVTVSPSNNPDEDDDIQIITENIPAPGRPSNVLFKVNGNIQSTNTEKRRFHYNVVKKISQKGASAAIAEFVKRYYPGEFGIVYCYDDDEAIDLELELRKLGVSTGTLLSGQDAISLKNEELWARHQVNVLCASRSPKQWRNKRLRFIFHATLPASLGRFRKRLTLARQKQGVIDCTIFYLRYDMHSKYRYLFRGNDDQVLQQRTSLYAVAAFCEDQISCRRQMLSRLVCEKTHLSCDNCLGRDRFEWLDVSQKARIILGRLKNGSHTIRQIADRIDGCKAKEITLKILYGLIHRGYLTESCDGYNKYPRAYRTVMADEVMKDDSLQFEINIQWEKEAHSDAEEIDILEAFDEEELDESTPSVKKLKLEVGLKNEVSDDEADDWDSRDGDSNFSLRLSPVH